MINTVYGMEIGNGEGGLMRVGEVKGLAQSQKILSWPKILVMQLMDVVYGEPDA